ncbi:MAG: hypothetical protein IJS01_15600, partial [Lentisphaeria bacterium]|nr:hypothetical protein [Lentisphaeria bacterium]
MGLILPRDFLPSFFLKKAFHAFLCFTFFSPGERLVGLILPRDFLPSFFDCVCQVLQNKKSDILVTLSDCRGGSTGLLTVGAPPPTSWRTHS